jgi:hypothetical protein
VVVPEDPGSVLLPAPVLLLAPVLLAPVLLVLVPVLLVLVLLVGPLLSPLAVALIAAPMRQLPRLASMSLPSRWQQSSAAQL